MLDEPRNGIQQKQKLLDQHRRNLNYLEQQAALCGLNLPLDIHNALVLERDAIALLERELASLGVSAGPKAVWQALVIDTDSHWRDIVASNIEQLGGAVIESQRVPRSQQRQILKSCSLVILGVSRQNQDDPLIRPWIEGLVRQGASLPVILLASWEDRDPAITLRNTIRKGNMNITVTTIFKETFDLYWFTRVVHQTLTR